MKTIVLFTCLTTTLFANNLFYNIINEQWIGVESIPCNKDTKLSIDATKSTDWQIGDFFINENRACFIITKILDGDVKTEDIGGTYNVSSYENGIVNGAYKSFLSDGTLKHEIFFVNGKKISMKEYYENGILKLEEHYKNNILDGQKVEYEFNGRPKNVTFYLDGKKHGIERLYNAQGRPAVEYEYHNNIKLPLNKKFIYDNDGDFACIESYNGTIKHGSWLYYTKDGSIEKEIAYMDGVKKENIEYLALASNDIEIQEKNELITGTEVQKIAAVSIEEANVSTVSMQNNTILAMQKIEEDNDDDKQEIYKDTLLEISSSLIESITKYDLNFIISNMAIFYNTNQQIWYSVTTKDLAEKPNNDAITNKNVVSNMCIGNTGKKIASLPTGVIKINIPQENLWMSIEANNGVANGWLKSYHESGMQKLNIFFLSGKKQGVAREISNDGIMLAKWFYNNDKISGFASFYYPNGIQKAFINFKNSKPDGKATFFDENGKIIGNITYKNGIIQ